VRRFAVAFIAVLTLCLLLTSCAAARPMDARGGVTPADLPINENPSLVPTMEFEVAPRILTGGAKYAVVIGISDYDGYQYDLDYCDDDARDLYDALVNVYGFSPNNIELLIDHQATHANILAAVDWLLASEVAGDTVVFAYSGHGSRGRAADGDSERTDECIIPWELSALWDGILAQRFAQLDSTDAWISFDSCYAGGMDDPGTAGSGHVVTMACSESSYSYEGGDVENGYYTYLMVELGMTEGLADSNGDGTVTVEEAYNYMKANIKSYSPQKPEINDQYPGDLIL